MRLTGAGRLLPLLAIASLCWSPASAQTEPCRFLCPPELLIEPTFTAENIARRPRIEQDGAITRVDPSSVFELVFAVDVPTRARRIGLTGEAIWSPGEAENQVELEFELNLHLILPEHTDGWVTSHVDVVDQFGPAERPHDAAAYTHKLDFELDTAVALFKRMPAAWLRDVELEMSLDYLASGLPRRGDEIAGVRYLDRASPWSMSVVVVIPIAPR